MNTKRTKLLAIIFFVLGVMIFSAAAKVTPTKVSAAADDPVVTYKAKCAMCHGPAAAKAFDPTKPEAEMVDAILKGKKAEKPPNMPAFEAKGIDADGAKALVAYMKTLKEAK